MISKEDLNARAIRLSGGRVNRYTGTPNDPHADAMSNYAGPGWGQFFGGLQQAEEAAYDAGKSYRVGWGGFGNVVDHGVGGGGSVPRQSLAAMRPPPSADDGGIAMNQYLSDLQDERRAKEQTLRAMTLRNDEASAAASNQAEVERALAIANDPNTSQYGRPIAAVGPMGVGPSGRPVSASGTYTTLRPNPAEPQPPVNRQAVAAQMAPGLIPPPAPPPVVTFGAPVKASVNGKSVFVRTGSDGNTYDMGRKPIDPATIAPPVDDGPIGKLETVVGPDGKARLVTQKDAIGKEPAAGTQKSSTGVQKRVLNFFNRAQQADTELEGMESEIQKMGLLEQGRLSLAPNIFQSQIGQSYQAAQRAFTEARLRKDSGAAIPPHEFDSDRQTYFAQPGDTQATLEQKRRARGAMLASLGFESGQALGEFVGDEGEAKAIVQQYKDRAAGKKAPAADASAAPGAVTEGTRKPIPNGGGVAEFRGGKWIRVE